MAPISRKSQSKPDRSLERIYLEALTSTTKISGLADSQAHDYANFDNCSPSFVPSRLRFSSPRFRLRDAFRSAGTAVRERSASTRPQADSQLHFLGLGYVDPLHE